MEQFIAQIDWLLALQYMGLSLFNMFLSGYFGGSETAFLSLNRILLYAKQGKGFLSAKILMFLVKNSSQFLTSIVILNNITLILGTLYLNKFFIEALNIPSSFAVILTMMTATPFALVLGEVLPKAIFHAFADAFSYALAGSWFIIYVLMYPITFIVRILTRVILFIFRVKYEEASGLFGQHEFGDFLDISLKNGAMNERERVFINNTLEFREVQASEAMTPLSQLVCIEQNQTVLSTLDIMKKNKISILPVYKSRIDEPIGRVRAKDLISADPKDTVDRYIQEAFFVPETAYLEKVLVQMQRQNMPLAFVADEYGGVVGVLRVEDIISEIVGEVVDEGEIDFKILADGTVTANGLCDIDDLFEELKLDFFDIDSKTLSGFMMEELGRMPKVGDIVFKKPWYFEIVSLQGRRVNEVIIKKTMKKKTENNNKAE